MSGALCPTCMAISHGNEPAPNCLRADCPMPKPSELAQILLSEQTAERNEIERLRADLAEAVEALKPFASSGVGPMIHGGLPISAFCFDDIRRARGIVEKHAAEK